MDPKLTSGQFHKACRYIKFANEGLSDMFGRNSLEAQTRLPRLVLRSFRSSTFVG